MHWHHHTNVLHIFYLREIYLIDTTSEWCTTFEHTFLISFVYPLRCCNIWSFAFDSFNKYLGTTVVAETIFRHCGFESDLTIGTVVFTRIIVYFNPNFLSWVWMIDQFSCQANLWFFDTSLSLCKRYYDNLSSLMVCCSFLVVYNFLLVSP